MSIKLYLNGLLSTKQAADMAGLMVGDLLEELRMSRIPFLLISTDDEILGSFNGPVVADAGPLIVFRRTGYMWLLKELFGSLRITESVKKELYTRDMDFFSFMEFLEQDEHDQSLSEWLSRAVDMELAESLSLAMSSGLPLLVDSGMGIRMANVLGVKALSTLQAFVLAKKRGVLKSISPVISRLSSMGFEAPKDAVRRLLADLGEGLPRAPPEIKL